MVTLGEFNPADKQLGLKGFAISTGSCSSFELVFVLCLDITGS